MLSPAPIPGAAPQLSFGVNHAGAVAYAAVPTLSFELALDAGGAEIRSVLLDVQIQIAARRRGYSPAAQSRLGELFGTPDRWATTLRTLPWLRSTLVVPAFTGASTAELTLPVSYDLEVSAHRYLAALEDGMVPLELLFSGTVFYAGPGGLLQTCRIPWNQEVDFALAVATWREAIDRHFPDSAWLRLGRESFDRLCAFKAQGSFVSFDAAVDALLEDR